MKYMAEAGVVHRDLAARTCLVGPRLKVKVADFGLTGGGRYAADYCRMDDGTALALRWAALESVVMVSYADTCHGIASPRHSAEHHPRQPSNVT